jgi:hypothetical protein
MRYVFRNTIPPVSRVLFIESGSRSLSERFSPILRMVCGGAIDVDLLTCLPPPEADSVIMPHRVYQSQTYPTNGARRRLLRELRANDYQVLVMLCEDSPVLLRWKWWLALRLPVKVLVANENADCYWLDMANWRSAKGMLAARHDLHGTGSLRALLEMMAFPVVLSWLLLYAFFAHTRRGFRVLFGLHRA